MSEMKKFPFSKRFPEVLTIGSALSGIKPDTIPLYFGFPAPEAFPVSSLIEASAVALQSEGHQALQYTGGPGQNKVKEWVRQRSRLRNIEVEIENILITTGSNQGIDLLARTLADAGEHVWVEAPTYFGALNYFRLAEVELTSFPIDENGLRVDLVEEALIDAKKNGKPIPKFLYVIPNYQNPAGINLSVERRKRLAELADAYNFYIIEDDAYVELSFTGKFLPSIYSFGSERVIYLSTFSKVIAPGLRMGWAIAGKEVLDKMRMVKSDGNTSVFVQEVISQFLDSGDFDAHCKKLISYYRSRRDAMIDAVEEYLHKEVSYILPEGGFFLWLTFPSEVDVSKFLQSALDRGVSYIEGSHFYLEAEEKNSMRLCFSYCNEEQIHEGIKHIADSYFEYTKNPKVLKEV